MLETGDSSQSKNLGISSILHSAPFYDTKFSEYCSIFNLLPAILTLTDLEKTLCVVNFHPQYELPKSFVGFGHLHTLTKLKSTSKQKINLEKNLLTMISR